MQKKSLAALLATALLTQQALALDLLQVYQEALANDPIYTSARYSLEAGQEAGTQGRAGLLPAIEARGSVTKVDGDAEIRDVDTPRDSKTTSYSLSLTQPLFRWANWQQYQQGKLSVALSEAQFAQAQQDLIVRVSQAYFDVLAAQDTLASVQAQKSAISEQLAAAKRNFEVGTATITDTHEAQARFDLVGAQELSAQSDLDIKKSALEQIIGKPAGRLAGLRSGMQLSGPQPAQMNTWVESAETQNYAVIGQELNREIAQREISRRRAGHLPTVDLVASRNHNNQRGSTLTNPVSSIYNDTVVGVQWNIPLFSGFAVSSQVREAVALAEKARSDLENARRTAAQDARQSYLAVSSGLAQVKALEAAEISSQSALESNQLGYEVGVRINIDVLNAQQQLYATRRDLARARYDTLVNSLKLKSAAGILKEEDLAEVNRLLSPAVTAGQTLNSSSAKSISKASPLAGSTATSPETSTASDQEKQVLNLLQNWAAAWSARDVHGYLSYYGKDFKPSNGQSRTAWEKQRQRNIANKKHIEVKISSPVIALSGDTATVRFQQTYTSGTVQDRGSKIMMLSRQNGKWQILQEQSAS